MGELLAFLFVCFGFVGASTLLSFAKPIQKVGQRIHPMLGKMVSCPGCLGFWTGIVIAGSGLNPLYGSMINHAGGSMGLWIFEIVYAGLMSSGFCLLLHSIVKDLFLGSEVKRVQLEPYYALQKKPEEPKS